MSAVAKTRISEAEYLARENASEFKSEYYDGEVFAMTGGSIPHNAIKDNIVGELYLKLKGGKCRSFSSDQRVKVETSGLYTYPDLVIVCGEVEAARSDPKSVVNPQVIIEILSPSTEVYDRSTKFQHYKKFASLREYILVAQDRKYIERYERHEGQSWLITTFEESEFTFASLPITLQMDDIYAKVEFPPPVDPRPTEAP